MIIMVKEIRKKRKQSVIPSLRKSRHKGQGLVSDNRMAFGELQILFYLKRRGSGASPTDLTNNALRSHTYDRESICENLIRKKLIKKDKISRKSFVYAITSNGEKACKGVLDILKDIEDLYDLEWLKNVRKIINRSYKEVEL